MSIITHWVYTLNIISDHLLTFELYHVSFWSFPAMRLITNNNLYVLASRFWIWKLYIVLIQFQVWRFHLLFQLGVQFLSTVVPSFSIFKILVFSSNFCFGSYFSRFFKTSSLLLSIALIVYYAGFINWIFGIIGNNKTFNFLFIE